MKQRQRPKSTNPFDNDEPDEDDNDNLEDIFHDAQQNQQEVMQRSAKLNFENPFEDGEDPALKFDAVRKVSNEFFSPLENAMMQVRGTMAASPTKNVGYTSYSPNYADLDDDDITESSPLLRSNAQPAQGEHTRNRKYNTSPGRRRIPTEITTGGPMLSPARNSRTRSSIQKSKQDLVLKELGSGENEFTMDYKNLLLEDLGTASSWIVLLLPYFAFLLSLWMESSRDFRVTTTDPIYPFGACNVSLPMVDAPDWPCFAFEDESMDVTTNESKLVFDSGIMTKIPILSTYLYGDASFQGLSPDVVAMVSQGLVKVSLILLQEDLVSAQNESSWSLMFHSVPVTLSMVCQNSNIDSSLWDCRAPQLIDVVFSMPDAAIYAGGSIRVKLQYSTQTVNQASDISSRNSTAWRQKKEASYVYLSSKRDTSTLLSTHVENIDKSLQTLVEASSYTFEHMSKFSLRVDAGVRLGTFLISFWFTIYWCYKMGLQKQFRCCSRKDETILWWESPWILFPSRNYIVVLLFSLLVMQQPGLVVMLFYPTLAASSQSHIIADATIGIGVQGTLFVYFCLFHGFRYHTAQNTKRRNEHQRQMLQLRRAIKYVTKAQDSLSPTEQGISDYTKDYFGRFGDVDGSASTSHLRLSHDPFADGWADFLLFKLLLLLIGVASVIGTAYCRFPPDDNDVSELPANNIHRYKMVYIACMIVQFLSLLLWMYLILVAALVTGRKLRVQPFLSTRPVQLAYRILFAHMALGFIALTVSFLSNLSRELNKWTLGLPERPSTYTYLASSDHVSKTELTIRILSQIAQQFPYSGTAASVGSGKILFATVSILITAFIFLPAHLLDEEDDEHYIETWGTTRTKLNDQLHEHRRLRRDKRLVVNLARDSRTWRVFPLPIQQTEHSNTMLQDDVFQLYTDMTIDGDTGKRGVVSVGPYTPVFCLEIASWLNEASWQAYYAPIGIVPRDPAMGSMDLGSLGLRLEGAVYDESTDTQVYVSSNIAPQVDGDEDSIIVVSFRGSASTINIQTDLKSKQVPLQDQLAGIGSAPFCIYPDRYEVYDEDGWIWETPEPTLREFLQCVTSWTSTQQCCVPSHHSRETSNAGIAAVSEGARKLLQATPVARTSFPLVHQGFQEVYTTIRQKLLEILFPVVQRQLARSMATTKFDRKAPLALPKIYCTGHSLGGSLAQLLALDLANNCEIVLPAKVEAQLERFYDAEMGTFRMGSPTKSHKPTTESQELRLQLPVGVYTFGQPRVGNRAFSRLYKQKVPHSFRVVNEGDPITTMPNYLFCGGVYKHSGLEVILDEGMTGNILVGPTVVETLFRFHKIRASLMAHTMQRYRDCLECAFAQDELLEYYRGHNLVVDKDRHSTTAPNSTIVDPAEIPEWMTAQART